MVENLNKKYNFLLKEGVNETPLNLMKQFINNIDPNILLELCPILTVPKNTIIFHSNKFTCQQLLDEITFLNKNGYSLNFGCNVCNKKNPHLNFSEDIGDKPRISEIANNPNWNNKGKCICSTRIQSRLFGNFNFIGNYDIALNNQMKGTQVFITKEEMKLIDTSFLSIELGFSIKKESNIGDTNIYKTYCEEKGFDGIIFLDYVDKQLINREHDEETFKSACLSCYKLNPDFLNEHNPNAFICPEFSLIHEIGNGGVLGSAKLAIIGMIDLVNNTRIPSPDKKIRFEPLSRIEVKNKFNMLFSNHIKKFHEIAKEEPEVKIYINYSLTSIYKNISISFDDEIFDFYDILSNNIDYFKDKNEFYIKWSDIYEIHGNILVDDLEVCTDAIEGVDDNQYIDYDTIYGKLEIISLMNFNKCNPIPFFKNEYKNQNNDFIYNKASDRLFNYFLSQFIATNLQIEDVIPRLKNYWIPCDDTINIYFLMELFSISYLTCENSQNIHQTISHNISQMILQHDYQNTINYFFEKLNQSQKQIIECMSNYIFNFLNDIITFRTNLDIILQKFDFEVMNDILQNIFIELDNLYETIRQMFYDIIEENPYSFVLEIYKKIYKHSNLEYIQFLIERRDNSKILFLNDVYNILNEQFNVNFNINIDTFINFVMTNSVQSAGYKNKYIKYKQKYLNLKKKLLFII